ncbi:MAG: signal peptidase I [Acidothermaceae bacterium]
MVDEPNRSDVADDADASEVPTDSIAAVQPEGSASSGVAGGSHRKPKQQRPFWVEAVALLAIALAIALVVHQFFFQAFFIPSGSMENTLHVGDRVLVNRMSYKVGHVQRGQIIVFNGEDSWTPEATTSTPSNPVARAFHDVGGFLGFAPSGEKDFIKRVIGIPGDHVVCCDSKGRITVNGKALDESYLSAGVPVATPTTTKVNSARPFDIVVPAGRVWVEGDHRDDSADSRSHTGDPGGGTIPESKIIGRAFVIVWPLGHWRGLAIPKSFTAVAGAATFGTSTTPYGVGLAAVLPVGALRFRRRLRRRRSQ